MADTYASCPPMPAQTGSRPTDEIGSRVGTILARLSELNESSMIAVNRFTGDYPRTESNCTEPKVKANGWLSELAEALDKIERNISDIEYAIRRLDQA